MKYCVVTNTIKVIDGSENPREIMIQNAVNAGFTDTEVEILTAEEYEVRKALEPIISQPPTGTDRLAALESSMLAMMGV